MFEVADGTGFDKIIQEYEDADERHKPFVYSSSDHFTLFAQGYLLKSRQSGAAVYATDKSSVTRK